MKVFYSFFSKSGVTFTYKFVHKSYFSKRSSFNFFFLILQIKMKTFHGFPLKNINALLSRSIIFFLLITCSPLLHAQFNLNYYLTHALKANPTIAENKNLSQIEKLEIRRVKTALTYPEIYFSSDVLLAPYFNNNGNFFTTNPQPGAIGYDVGITNGGLYSGLINAKLPLFNNRRFQSLKEFSDIQIKKNLYNVNLTKHGLVKAVTDQYLRSLGHYEQLKYAREIIKLLADQKEIIDHLVRTGVLRQSEYFLINIEYHTQLVHMHQLQAEYKKNLLQLNALCGINDTVTVTLAPYTLHLNISQNRERFMESFRIDSLTISNQQKLFENKYFPMISLFGNAGLNAVTIPDIQHRFGVSAGLSLTWNIFDGHQNKINEQKNKLRFNTVEVHKNYFAKQNSLNLQSDLDQLKITNQNITLLEKQAENFQDLLEIYKMQLAKGQLSVIDYINTLKLYVGIQESMITSKTKKQLLINDYNYWNW